VVPAACLYLPLLCLFYFFPFPQAEQSVRVLPDLELLEVRGRPFPDEQLILERRTVPDRYLSALSARSDPITAGVAPSAGKTSFGGASGKMHCGQGALGDCMNESLPSMPQMLPYTNGSSCS
jgi:hypothetical protein